jgi:ParB-like chromosome segregation protein Spo0J
MPPELTAIHISSLADLIGEYLGGAVDLDQKVERINALRKLIAEHSPFKDEPVDLVEWVPAASVHANDYNPNSVAPPEMELLRLSITSDGYTQPIVTMPDSSNDTREVIDGFHRNRVGKECPDIQRRVQGYLPVVTIREDRKDKNDRIAATIRHNRARGKHRVDAMSEIVIELKRRNWTDERIGKELGMEPDEVLRLCQISGLAELFSDDDFSASWDAVDQEADESQQDIDDGAEFELYDNPAGGMTRIFHTYEKWECFPAGFYENRPKDSPLTDNECREQYAVFLRDIPRFEAAMTGVLQDWPNSTEHYLSNERMNRIAWLGQAAMCYATGIPARYSGGYQLLSEDEKLAANTAALTYLNKWLESRGEKTFESLEAADNGLQVNIY